MKAYLCEFLKDYAYPEDAARVLLDAYDRIAASAEARTLWEGAIALYEADCLCNYDDVLAAADRAAQLIQAHPYTAELLIFLCLSKHLRTLYLERGIDLAYYRKSMEDLRYKLEECMLVYGIVGSFVARWFVGFFCLKRFGIGRLQFEVVPFKSNYERDGLVLTTASKVLNVHIPRSGEPLSEEACCDAYRAAKAFFQEEIQTDPCPFVCHSWLLHPPLEAVFPKHSNTYRFLKSYDVLETDADKNGDNLWRLFDTMEKNPDRLPADSSLRRAMIDYLKQGGTLGEGYGVLLV